MGTNYGLRQKIMMLILLMIAVYMLVILPQQSRDDSDGITATCTVTKAYWVPRGGIVSGMTDNTPKGLFETEECGTLTMFEPPEGWKISEYVKTAQPRKKYLFHVSNRSPKKDRDFVTTRFEEIKE